MFIWEHKKWPHFTRDNGVLLEKISTARLAQGRLLGNMSRLGFDLKLQAQLSTLTEDVVKSSEIEGEHLAREDVRSSVARRLGVPFAGVPSDDAKTEGVVELMMDATENFAEALTVKRLLKWQAALFPTGYSGFHKIRTGKWRNDATGPMQVVSGPLGRQKIHFEAPPAKVVELEMNQFLEWFNARREPEGLLRAATAHLWFVTIHPFDDGNGRIARAIADMALAQSEESPQRFYSMSSQIRKERAEYYRMLEKTQKGALDITPWLSWFLNCFTRAVEGADELSGATLRRAEFWQTHMQAPLNERQRVVLNRLLDEFEGNLTARKWAAMGKCSMPTAQRDIADLIERNILRKNPGGSKNTSYSIIV